MFTFFSATMKRVNKRASVVSVKDEMRFNVTLIRAIQKEPFLYDFRMAEYAYNEKHKDAWQRIAKQLNESGMCND